MCDDCGKKTYAQAAAHNAAVRDMIDRGEPLATKDGVAGFVGHAGTYVPCEHQERHPMNLFMTGDFTLASGRKSGWKIECDALTPEDWKGLAAMAVQFLPPFGEVLGVPRGGLAFAEALGAYVTVGGRNVLIAEDVVTTGGSMERFRATLHTDGLNVIGVCAFARGTCPAWVTPLFRMPGA